jgi:methionyl-tRNA synthetase
MPGKPYYITTAIAYPNGAPHIGHAYERSPPTPSPAFMRLDGRDVFFLTGTDEHGIKMLQTAARENLTPRELVERNVPRFQAMVTKFNCSNDDFIRTTEPRHYRRLGASGRRCRLTATSISTNMPAGTRCATRPITTRAKPASTTRAAARPAGHAGRMGRGGELFLSALRLSDKLLKLYEQHPDFVLPGAHERSRELRSRRPARICRFRAPRSTGASRCPAIRSTSCMSGSMR